MRRTQGLRKQQSGTKAVSLERALSKLGLCSRTVAGELIAKGHVRVNGTVRRDPAWRIAMERDRILVDGRAASPRRKIYLAVNKPRGLVTTVSDERGRETVYSLLTDPKLPWVSPVGRLDRASEGLLLFTNDTRIASLITAPASHLDKTYHVQIDRPPDVGLMRRMEEGVRTPDGDLLAAKRVSPIRQGEKTGWLEVVLDEGKNRQIRRLLDSLGVEVLRLVRISIGPIELGRLPKGAFRHLTGREVVSLRQALGLDEPKR